MMPWELGSFDDVVFTDFILEGLSVLASTINFRWDGRSEGNYLPDAGLVVLNLGV